MSAEIDAIRKRWRTDYDRGAHDYTDAGCRILAEHAFKDIHTLLAALSSEDATRPTGDSKSGPEDGQSDTAPMKRPVMEGVHPAATDSGHVGASTYVWLIERGQAEHQEPTAWVTTTGPIAWTTNAYAAIRFQTREAAQAFIAEHLTHPTRGPSARAVQHGFARPTGDKE